eukprot:scaffold283222_cov45-Attheya_sp.AAC.1
MSGCRVRAHRTRDTIWPNCVSCPVCPDIAQTDPNIVLSRRHKKASVRLSCPEGSVNTALWSDTIHRT